MSPASGCAGSVPLVQYAEPRTGALEAECQARTIIAVLCLIPRRWIELDFTGVTCVSSAFGDEFMKLAERELPETWLVPRHYGHPGGYLINRLLNRLKRLRKKAWITGCERFMTGTGPQSML
jgi:hypothetical protein